MISAKIMLLAVVCLKVARDTNGLSVRQLDTNQRVSVSPIISSIAAIPRAAIDASLGLSTGGRQGSVIIPNVSATTASTGGAQIGTSAGLQQSNIGGSGINVLRRGTNYVADQIVSALGGVATLSSALDNVTQGGEIYSGNLGASIEALIERLLNTGVNAATSLVHELFPQASSSQSFRLNVRPNRFYSTFSGPTDVDGQGFSFNTFPARSRENWLLYQANGNGISSPNDAANTIPFTSLSSSNLNGPPMGSFSASNLNGPPMGSFSTSNFDGPSMGSISTSNLNGRPMGSISASDLSGPPLGSVSANNLNRRPTGSISDATTAGLQSDGTFALSSNNTPPSSVNLNAASSASSSLSTDGSLDASLP